MGLTFGVIALLAVAIAAIGLMMARYTRWRPVSAVDLPAPAHHARATGTIVVSVIVLAVVVLVLLWGWGLVALPH